MKTRRLRTKITSIMMLIILLLGVFICIIIKQVLSQVLEKEAKQKILLIAKDFANHSANLILTENFLALNNVVAEEKQLLKDIFYVFVMDSKNNVLAHTFKEGLPTELKTSNNTFLNHEGNIQLLDTGDRLVYDVAVPILAGNIIIGTARIGLSKESIEKTIRTTLGVVVAATLLALLSTIFIGFGFASLIIEPINKLRQASEEMIKGNLDVKVDIKTGDEIQQLADAFNLMTTERKRLEEALSNSERNYRNIFENATEGIFQSTPEGRYIIVNPAFARIGGYNSPDEMIDTVTDIQKTMYVHQEDRARLYELLKKQDQVTKFEAEIRRRDGAIICISMNVRAVRDQGRKIIFFEGTIEDITERKRAEEEIQTLTATLEQRVADRTSDLRDTQLAVLNVVDDLNKHAKMLDAANEKMALANKELEAFSYSVSHDLRAPLRHLGGFVELLNEKLTANTDEETVHYLKVISDSAAQMSRLVDDLLSFSRMGRVEMSKARVRFDTLAGEAIDTLQPATRGREIVWKIAPLPEVTGDAAMLRLVMVNLIANAVKFTGSKPKAEITIGCDQSNENEYIFSVRDNGAGFDMKYADKLFHLFQRLHRADEFEGTGAGLANVRRIIQRHGGRTWAEGAVGSGAVFYFSLPRETPVER